jgi:benzodiazapine receptor
MNRTKTWYSELRKPFFAPPSGVFGPVWSVLYLIIAVSFGYTAYESYLGIVPSSVVLLLVLNLIFNFLYTPLQFGLRNLVLATVDILLVLLTLILSLNSVYAYIPWVTYVNIPYLFWVTFATALQVSITLMNRNKWKIV